jgi:hypothetical protein
MKGQMLAEMKESAAIFAELNYDNDGVELELQGIETFRW